MSPPPPPSRPVWVPCGGGLVWPWTCSTQTRRGRLDYIEEAVPLGGVRDPGPVVTSVLVGLARLGGELRAVSGGAQKVASRCPTHRP